MTTIVFTNNDNDTEMRYVTRQGLLLTLSSFSHHPEFQKSYASKLLYWLPQLKQIRISVEQACDNHRNLIITFRNDEADAICVTADEISITALLGAQPQEVYLNGKLVEDKELLKLYSEPNWHYLSSDRLK